MPTLKETLEELNLEVELPEPQYNYPVLADYESYEYKTIDGEKCIVLRGYGIQRIPLILFIHLEKKKIMEYNIHGENDYNLLRSMDKDGVMPFH